MTKKKSNSNKVKKNPCPCANTKENFKNSDNELTIIDRLNEIDDIVVSFFGNSKLIIDNKSYKLKNYRWFIIITILLLLILLVYSIRSAPHKIASSVPIIVNPVSTPVVLAK